MVKVKTDEFARTARTEAERAAERAMEEAERRTEGARIELGRVVHDAAAEYFPEAANERRRRDVSAGFVGGLVAGLGVGAAVAYALRR